MKNVMYLIGNDKELLLQKDWYSLGSRTGCWKGSPWRAIALLRH